MLKLPNFLQFYNHYHIPAPWLDTRWGIARRALVCDLSNCATFLKKKGKFFDSHMLRFHNGKYTGEENDGRYGARVSGGLGNAPSPHPTVAQGLRSCRMGR
jgi:hypothetical protein